MTENSVENQEIQDGLQKLGANIRAARIKRSILMVDMAAIVGCTRATLTKIETGSPKVAIGTYMAVLQRLGLMDGLVDSADARLDKEGRAVHRGVLGQRVRR